MYRSIGVTRKPLIGDVLQIDRVEYPEKAEKEQLVTVKAWGICHADPGTDCEGYMKFIRQDTGETIRVPPENWHDVPRNQTKLFIMPAFEMPGRDVSITIEPWEHDPWPRKDDKGTPRTITIRLWEYTYGRFISFDGETGPFAPGKTGKIADCVVKNTGNSRGNIYGKCFDEDGVEVDSWAIILDPGSTKKACFNAKLPDREGSYTYKATCRGEDDTEVDERSWTLRIEEEAPPPEPPEPPPSSEGRDPLDTFIKTMEKVRPKCPIATIETTWLDFTEKVIEATPPIKILPPE